MEIHSGAKDTHALAVAAKTQAAKAETISASIAQAVTELRSTAEATNDSVKAIQSQTRVDQRPWIEATPSFTGESIQVGQSLAAKVSYRNIGKTPALNIVGQWSIRKVSNGEKLRFTYGPHSPGNVATTGIVYPSNKPLDAPALWMTGNKPAVGEWISVRNLTESDMKELNDGKAFFILYGRIRYTDGFKLRHWTKFCAPIYAAGPPRAFTSGTCFAYNSVDDNY